MRIGLEGLRGRGPGNQETQEACLRREVVRTLKVLVHYLTELATFEHQFSRILVEHIVMGPLCEKACHISRASPNDLNSNST